MKNSQENTCARGANCNFIKKESLAQVFSCEFFEICKSTFLTEHLWATASVNKIITFEVISTLRQLLSNFIKQEVLAQILFFDRCEIFQKSFFYRTLLSSCFCRDEEKIRRHLWRKTGAFFQKHLPRGVLRFFMKKIQYLSVWIEVFFTWNKIFH